MTQRRVLLDTAAFMDSAHAVSVQGAPTADIREVVQRFVASCYDDVGVAPHLLDGEGLTAILREHLPRRFGAGDPLVEAAAESIGAFLGFLREKEFVPAAMELTTALGEHAQEFAEIVASGAAHAEGITHPGKGKTIRHDVERVGRNDPCPCGSGKKFKKCCMGTGGKP